MRRLVDEMDEVTKVNQQSLARLCSASLCSSLHLNAEISLKNSVTENGNGVLLLSPLRNQLI